MDAPLRREHLHVLLLDPFYRPPSQPGSTRTHDIAARLVDAGHHVTAITTTAALPPETDFGAVDGIAISVPLPELFGRAPPAGALAAFARGLAWRAWRVAEVDAVVLVDRPVRALPWVMLYCVIRGIPLILDARLGPPSAPASVPLGRRLRTWVARIVYGFGAGYARKVIAVSGTVAETLASRGVAPASIAAITPGCDVNFFTTSVPGAGTTAPDASAGPYIAFAGVMDEKLEPVIPLAAALRTQAPDLSIVLCGDGPARARLEADALAQGVLDKTVLFLDPKPRRELPALLLGAQAVLATGHANHFADALAAGKPLIMVGPGAERELVESRGAGLGLTADTTAAARELADFLRNTDSLRRASQQSAALAAGKINLERTAAEYRAIILDAVAQEPRALVMRRRMLGVKRLIDVVVAIAGLVVLSPVFVVIAGAIGFNMGWPILFMQMRPGLHGRLFRILKFRTMTVAPETSDASTDERRLTPLGQFLRLTSLDELPELFNVLVGHMSLVGPRPLLPEYLPYYSPEQKRRHDLRPGMTGWSQVNGRNALTWEEKFALDVWYVDNVSLWLDAKIILKTAWVALTGEGVSAPGHATTPRFDEIMARRQGAEDV